MLLSQNSGSGLRLYGNVHGEHVFLDREIRGISDRPIKYSVRKMGIEASDIHEIWGGDTLDGFVVQKMRSSAWMGTLSLSHSTFIVWVVPAAICILIDLLYFHWYSRSLSRKWNRLCEMLGVIFVAFPVWRRWQGTAAVLGPVVVEPVNGSNGMTVLEERRFPPERWTMRGENLVNIYIYMYIYVYIYI